VTKLSPCCSYCTDEQLDEEAGFEPSHLERLTFCSALDPSDSQMKPTYLLEYSVFNL
jgi:hypothetical protein